MLVCQRASLSYHHQQNQRPTAKKPGAASGERSCQGETVAAYGRPIRMLKSMVTGSFDDLPSGKQSQKTMGKSPFVIGKSTISTGATTWEYPLVNSPKKRWKDPPCYYIMGPSTILTGPFSIAFCMFTRPGQKA